MVASVFLDNYYALRFVYLLTRAWTDTDAYKLGIIDEHGNPLKTHSELTSEEEKEAYTKFHMLVFNIKKMLEKLPLGKTTIARYAAALYLIREEIGHDLINENIITDTFLKHTKYIVEEGEASGCTTGGVDIVDGSIGGKQQPKKKKPMRFRAFAKTKGKKK